MIFLGCLKLSWTERPPPYAYVLNVPPWVKKKESRLGPPPLSIIMKSARRESDLHLTYTNFSSYLKFTATVP